jgi:hypothetical protein
MKVYAINDKIKKYIKHQPSGIEFDENGEADWPNDQFTQRRLRDGDTISLTPPGQSQPQVQQQKARTRISPPSSDQSS